MHHHRLVHVVDGAIALGAVGRGGDDDIALGLQAPDLAAAGGTVGGRRGRAVGTGAAARAVARDQPVGIPP